MINYPRQEVRNRSKTYIFSTASIPNESSRRVVQRLPVNMATVIIHQPVTLFPTAEDSLMFHFSF